jgi:hypothetical protein
VGTADCPRVRFSVEVGSVPDHRSSHISSSTIVIYTSFSVRWDPNCKDDNYFNQSVSLYTAYYNVQISIHRAFIPSPNKPSPLPFPSLTICTNAARSGSHVLYVQRKRNNYPSPQIQVPVRSSWLLPTFM